MSKKMKFWLVASFVAISLISVTGCNTDLSHYENNALKKELETVKNQLTDARKEITDLENNNKELTNTLALLQTPDIPDTLLPQLAYFLEQQGRSNFQSAYQTGTLIFNQQNVSEAKKMALTQYEHTMATLASKEFIEREGKRLQDAWASSNPITFPGQDRLNQLKLQSKDDQTAVIQAKLTRTMTVSPYNGQSTTEDLTLLITLIKTDQGWKLNNTTLGYEK
jgi:hypothetical protein